MKLACINIQGNHHFPRLKLFLQQYQPDVLCLQELYESDISFFQPWVGVHQTYAPMTRYAEGGAMPAPIGVGIFSRHPLQNITAHYYKGNVNEIPVFERGKPNRHVLLVATVEGLRLATTHVMVTEKGESTPEQREDVTRMLTFAKQEAQAHGNLILCGDFNAPRGRATFQLIAESFTDNIPLHYATSIDISLHKANKNPVETDRVSRFMVDGLFTTPTVRAQNVRLHSGVSDHMAITATLSAA